MSFSLMPLEGTEASCLTPGDLLERLANPFGGHSLTSPLMRTGFLLAILLSSMASIHLRQRRLKVRTL